MELNKQAISEIDNYILKNYDGYPHYKKLDVKENMITALTNPSIYSKAGLISLEQLNDLDDFIRWRGSNYYFSQHFGGWVSKGGIGCVTRTSAELFLSYQEFYKS